MKRDVYLYLIRKFAAKLLCLTVLGFVYTLAVYSVTSKAATITDLQKKFPHGAYWNHVVQSGHGYSGYDHVGPCNNPDGYTWTPCDTHTANAGIGGHDCNSFQSAIQCCGFAKKLAYDLYGSTHTSWGQTTVGNAKAGDVIKYTGGDAIGTHWAMIIGRSGTVLTLGECNYNGNCRINWGKTINTNSMSSYTIYSAPWAATYGSSVTDTTPPVISNVRVTEIDDSGYSVYCEVTDNVGVDRVQFPTWPAYKSSEGCPWPVGGNAANTWACRISYATFDNYKGLYHTHIYAYDKAGNSTCYNVNWANDNEPPTVSNIQVYSIDNTGYTISCEVTDNVDISRVQFPTWP